ncbi:hypothetical protein D9613_012121 [Agrocybe pediades]|uniref:Transcription activator GCR1-like domain-containing protein n=1 Tax=Agrocybe pediades TaxID=84607 RepID=A0A8H4R1S2_9AGAR|nr:hypothetical protein D9613_012121 [Agrocybe pediades]
MILFQLLRQWYIIHEDMNYPPPFFHPRAHNAKSWLQLRSAADPAVAHSSTTQSSTQCSTPSLHPLVDVNFPGPFTMLDPSSATPNNLQLVSSYTDHPAAKKRRIDDTLTEVCNKFPDATGVASVQLASTSGLISIREEAHRIRLDIEARLVSGKGTEKAYSRHLRKYEKFWNDYQEDQARQDPRHVPEPAHPIVGEKVGIFLKQELSRNKQELSRNKLDKNGRQLSGTSVGKEHIKQAISALQSYIRSNQHLPAYANCPDTRVLLRHQDWVKSFEVIARANEPTRVKEAHIMKTKETGADVYKNDEVLRMSNWLLREHGRSKHQICLALRDRAMLLLASNTAFRGDNTRRILLSDLFTQRVPMPLIGDAIELPLYLQIRPRTIRLEGLTNMAFFVIEKLNSAASVALPFTFLHTSTYKTTLYLHLPPTSKIQNTRNLDAETDHRERFLNMHNSCNVSVSHVTHACRFYAADKARKYGASGLEVKALGNWRTGDLYSEVYDRSLPTRAMLASALFNADEPRSYVLPRAHLVPPPSILSSLFPWVESEKEAYEGRVNKYGPKAVDIALRHFLDLVAYLRVVLIQDAAILYQKHPNNALWNYAPFNGNEFRDFSQQSHKIIEQAALEATENFKRLPEQVAATIHATLESSQIQRRLEHEDLISQLTFMRGFLSNLPAGRSSRKRGRNDGSGSGNSSDSSGICTPTPQELDSDHADSTVLCSTTSPTRRDLLKSQEVQSRQAFKNIILSPTPTSLYSLPNSSPEETPPTDILSLPRAQYLPDSENTTTSKWPPDLLKFQANFILSNDAQERAIQIKSIRELVKVFGTEKILCHQFEWSCSPKPSIPSEWLPFYVFNTNIKTIEDLWKEWTEGLDGCISVQQLNNKWAARWRRQNEGQKTEAARRKVITTLVDDLVQRPNWSAPLALRFLNEKYPVPSGPAGPKHLSSIRSFITHLQNGKTGKANQEEIMQAASSYCT